MRRRSQSSIGAAHISITDVLFAEELVVDEETGKHRYVRMVQWLTRLVAGKSLNRRANITNVQLCRNAFTEIIYQYHVHFVHFCDTREIY